MTQHDAQNEKILDQFTKQAESYAKLTASRAGALFYAFPRCDQSRWKPIAYWMSPAALAGSPSPSPN